MSKETVVETVTMTDGRVVEFAGKRKLLKAVEIRGDVVQVRLDFRNGQTRLFTVPPGLILQCAGHGASQKLGDATAALEDVEDQVVAVDDLIDQLYNGQWNVRREAGAFAGTSVLARALAELTGKTLEEIKSFLQPKSQAEKMALRANPKVAPIVERLEKEKAAKKDHSSSDALLESIGV